MQFKLNNKSITFLGLFFLASISLHSFAHIDDDIIEAKPQIECQSCLNEIAIDIESFSFITKVVYEKLSSIEISQNYFLELKKSFNSQAPPKIKI
ncbi:hypothetical protein OAT24_01620 [Gammaproteobacteria bacterium]|mgnify:FL=1|jgi:hypothetical protein|nr:hypothetical protein [Gammaproteobacteria bacterium]MDC1132208.1 hypothetical protein [Gammaproteobacteria bacterium]